MNPASDRKSLYKKQRQREQRYHRQVKAALGNYFFSHSSPIVDKSEATDFVVNFHSPGMVKVACRIRENDKIAYHQKYPRQFTIRSYVPGGHKTEMHKIRDGWASHMLYAHAKDNRLFCWYLLCLDEFRRQVDDYPLSASGGRLAELNENSDGTRFMAFDIDRFPDPEKLILKDYDNTSQM